MSASSDSPTTFEGFSSPNYTQVPDELFDVLLPTLADNELRVLLYIVRRTFGFKQETDTISLSQMVHGITTKDGQVLDAGTGLSKSTVARGLKSLREKGIIVATRNSSKERGDQPTTYHLRFRSDTKTTPAVNTPLSRHKDTPPVPSMTQAVSREWDTQYTEEQETDFESSNRGNLEWDQEQGQVDQTTSHATPTTSTIADNGLGDILKHRIRRDAGRDERQMIQHAIEQISPDLADRAQLKSSVGRAMHLYQAADLHASSFVDVLFRARGEVLDRYRHPGKAPIPRNKMAYFFAVVEDQLGLREQVEEGTASDKLT